MPNVRLSSGTIGTTRLADLLVAQQRGEDPDERHRRGDRAAAGRLELGVERRQLRHGQRLARLRPPDRQRPAQRGPPLAQVGLLRAALLEAQERQLRDLLVGQVDDLEAVAERAQHVLAHLLLLVGDVLALAGLTHPVALDRSWPGSPSGCPTLSTADW
jgi:hypothetical protein